MSLTKFLHDPDFGPRLEHLLKFPRIPPFGPHPLVPSSSPNAPLIGAAFDYLLRFDLQRRFPLAVAREWVAETGLRKLSARQQKKPTQFLAAQKTLDTATRAIHQARLAHADYLKHGDLSNDLLQAVLRLAQIDSLARSGIVPKWFGVVELHDMRELRHLMDAIPWSDLTPQWRCILNPTFGRASALVGGADADILFDDSLIEIKTTKNGAFSREYIKQLAGYYILQLIGGVDGTPAGDTIQYLGVYSARYGRIIRVPVREVVPSSSIQELTNLFQEFSMRRKFQN
ncbi:hypothetical protein [Myxococcus sp. AB056]|uniref:hypothetical protein n=1 Tax=Myxococcus sp. AB056 TaxID=2562792 RepID=UPI00114643E8|nr:hypothetical protein [Myxococcus sp. AB056]